MSGAATLVKAGTLVLPDGMVEGNLLVREGRIAAILAPDEQPMGTVDEVIDAHGLLVLPGGVDPHVHAEEPGQTESADFASVSRAAAMGGITTIVEMPLEPAPTTTPALLRVKIDLVNSGTVVDTGLYGALQPGSLGTIEALHLAGVLGFKAFMVNSELNYPSLGDGLLFEAMRRVAALPAGYSPREGSGTPSTPWQTRQNPEQAPGGIVLVHAESDTLVAAGIARMRSQGRHDAQAHPKSRPPICEVEAIERALLLARAAGCRLHVVHTSTPEGVERVQAARQTGQAVSCEVCPHHLLLDEDEYRRLGVWAKCTPPIRARTEVEGMWRHLLAGRIDALASDHSAATAAEKEAGIKDVWAAPNGIQSIDVGFPLVFSEGVWRRGLSVTAFARLTATNAARLLGLAPRKGAILPGADADLAIYDPHAEWTIDARRSFNKQPWSPFQGWTCRGQVVRTIVRGCTVYDKGEIVISEGWGRFLPGPIAVS